MTRVRSLRARLRQVALGSLLCLGVLLPAACGDEAECGDTVELPCDIRRTACRCTVFSLTRRVRGQSNARLPSARVITREQFARETRADSAGRTPSEGEKVYQRSLQLLGLLPTETSLDDAETEAQIGGVAAYYDSKDKRITIIDDSAEEETEGVFTLSHEYVHALQDQREGIDRLWDEENSTDGLLSVKTLLEGEAVLLSDLVLFDIRDRTFDSVSLDAFDRLFELTLDAIGMSPAPLTEAQLSLAYPVGANVLGKAYLARGVDGVKGFYTKRPPTVTGWLDEARSPMLPTSFGCAPPGTPAGYRTWGNDRLGATAVIALGASLGFENESLRELATAWNNDLFSLYSAVSGPDTVAVRWYIAFREPELASQLEGRLRSAQTGLDITRNGGELVIVGVTDPALLTSWSDRGLCAKSLTTETKPLGPDFRRFLRARLGHHHAGCALGPAVLAR